MKKKGFYINIDENVKQEVDEICETLGMSTGQAVNMFLKYVSRTGSIPIDLKVNRCPINYPNCGDYKEEAKKRILESNSEPNSKVYSSIDELFEDIEDDEENSDKKRVQKSYQKA
jgi:addiction module RelB/DinJ family antitoxin